MQKIIIVLIIFLSSNKNFAQKEIKYQYYGGHGCIDIDLELYEDSTFLFKHCSAIPFPHCSKKKGAYLLNEDAIHFYEKKRLHFLIPKLEWKYRETIFRKDENHIYLYNEDDLTDENADFMKAYYTLRLYKK